MVTTRSGVSTKKRRTKKRPENQENWTSSSGVNPCTVKRAICEIRSSDEHCDSDALIDDVDHRENVVAQFDSTCPKLMRSVTSLNPPTLRDWLLEGKFSLSLAPGFFGYFAHIGMLSAFDDAGLLGENGCRVESISGASAGALVGSMLATGMTPKTMRDVVTSFERSDFWDPLGFLGVLRGKAFEDILRSHLPVEQFDSSTIPLRVTGFDLFSLSTKIISTGCIPSAVRASCSFPVLFQPVWREGAFLTDGGAFDRFGIRGMDRPASGRVLHLNLDSGASRQSPPKIPEIPEVSPSIDIGRRSSTSQSPHCSLVSLSIGGLPSVGPFSLHLGPDTIQHARDATRIALNLPLVASARS